MTTEQKFFQNIVHSNAITYQVIENTIGDLNKNSGLSATFIEAASQVVGSSVTEDYDLASVFGIYADEVNSDKDDDLQQSLQNVISGIANTYSYPQYDVCTHISTSILQYSSGMSSSFLSGQWFNVSSLGIGNNSVISIPSSVLNLLIWLSMDMMDIIALGISLALILKSLITVGLMLINLQTYL
jgi:hypothetical protein